MRYLAVLLLAAALHAQPINSTASQARPVKTLPATCNPGVGSIVSLTTGSSKGLYSCTAANTWTYIGGGAVGPQGPTGPTGPTGPQGPQGPAGGGVSGLSTGKVPKAASATTLADSSLSDDGTTVSTPEVIAAGGFRSGASPPTIAGGSGIFAGEASAPSAGFPATGVDGCYADSTAHALLCSNNNDTALPITRTVAHGATAMTTGSLSANTCASTTTVSATGVLSTDVIDATANADISAAVGYGAGAAAGLKLYWFPTAGDVNFIVCNGTGTSITVPAMTLNWSVRR